MKNFIDLHTHVFPDSVAPKAIQAISERTGDPVPEKGTLSSLCASMKRNRCTASLLAPVLTNPEKIDSVISWHSSVMQSHSELIALGSLLPDQDWEKQFSKIYTAGFKGIKLHPYYQNFDLDDSDIFPLYRILEQEKMFVLFHTGFDIAFKRDDRACPEKLRNVREKFPDLGIIAAHLGGWSDWDRVLDTLKDLDLIFDTAYVDKHVSRDLADRIIENFGIDHLVFGSDFPWCSQENILAWVDSLKLTPEEEHRLLFSNAADFLKKYSIQV